MKRRERHGVDKKLFSSSVEWLVIAALWLSPPHRLIGISHMYPELRCRTSPLATATKGRLEARVHFDSVRTRISNPGLCSLICLPWIVHFLLVFNSSPVC